jgi:hypothetical protein
MPNVRVHQLGRKINVTLSVCIPEVDAFRFFNRNGIDLSLHRPGKEGVFLAEIDDFLSG